jgi:hypothetical protein
MNRAIAGGRAAERVYAQLSDPLDEACDSITGFMTETFAAAPH